MGYSVVTDRYYRRSIANQQLTLERQTNNINNREVRTELVGVYPGSLEINDEGRLVIEAHVSTLEEPIQCSLKLSAPSLKIYPAEELKKAISTTLPVSSTSATFFVWSDKPGSRHFESRFACPNGIEISTSGTIEVFEQTTWTQTILPILQILGLPALIGILVSEYLRRRKSSI